MTRRYIDLCESYSCKAKVYPKMTNGLKEVGRPDLMILFTGTVSPKMVKCALSDIGVGTKIARSHTSSVSALRNILDAHVGCRE